MDLVFNEGSQREYVKAFLNREFGCNQIASSSSLFAFFFVSVNFHHSQLKLQGLFLLGRIRGAGAEQGERMGAGLCQ
jgi:hypothetical protein